MKREKIMKSMSFKNRDEMVKCLKSIKVEMDEFFAKIDKELANG